jgi:hypothetical protein
MHAREEARMSTRKPVLEEAAQAITVLPKALGTEKG